MKAATAATTPVPVEQRSAPPPRRRRLRTPKFALAMPSWVWYLGFFVVPVMVIVWYSFGYKPPVNSGQGPIGTDHLSLQNYRDALSDTFFKTFQNTFRVAVIGTGPLPADRLPGRVLHRGEGAAPSGGA